MTDYVVFRNEDVSGGTVETGWHYSDENQTKPDREWCHFRSFPQGDGRFEVTPIEKLPELRSKCVWFNGGNEPT